MVKLKQIYTAGVLPLLGEVRWGGFTAKDKVTIKFNDIITNDGNIEFYGMMGNLAYTTAITKGIVETQININSLKSGLYFYTIKVNDTKITSGKITIINN